MWPVLFEVAIEYAIEHHVLGKQTEQADLATKDVLRDYLEHGVEAAQQTKDAIGRLPAGAIMSINLMHEVLCSTLPMTAADSRV